MTEEIGMPFDPSCFCAPKGKVRVVILYKGADFYATYGDFASRQQAIQVVLQRQQEYPDDQFYFYDDQGNLLQD